VVSYGPKTKIYIDDVIGTIGVEFYGLVLANGSASIPKYVPAVAPRIVQDKVYIDHFLT
jgi:hypothetical protein